MSSDELIKTLYQISDSFKETSLWPIDNCRQQGILTLIPLSVEGLLSAN